jgi:tRNA(fMet)-specific endonuclease VapC
LRYLWDTDTCIYSRRKPPKLVARLDKLEPGDIRISVVTYGELVYGATKSVNPTVAVAGLDRFIADIPVLPLPEDAGKLYGLIRSDLAVKGDLIGPNDLWIAAHAIAADMTLVTNNEREFRRVKGLKVENWLK